MRREKLEIAIGFVEQLALDGLKLPLVLRCDSGIEIRDKCSWGSLTLASQFTRLGDDVVSNSDPSLHDG